MGVAEAADVFGNSAVGIADPFANGRFIFVCEHASNHVPAEFSALGLAQDQLARHIAWDPGALPVVTRLARLLSAPLVESRISRLVIDCNRPLDAPDLIAETSETTVVPGNQALGPAARQRRIDLSYKPFHGALDTLIAERRARGLSCSIVTMHSFTPVYRGVARPWQVGVIHDDDVRLAAPVLAALKATPGLTVGDNEPYAPADRVYHTLEVHARSRGLPCVMLEIRNDEIATEADQALWADRLARIFAGIAVEETPSGEMNSVAKGEFKRA